MKKKLGTLKSSETETSASDYEEQSSLDESATETLESGSDDELETVMEAGEDLGAASNFTKEQAVVWVNAQKGQFLDYDGVYGAQCVDLRKH